MAEEHVLDRFARCHKQHAKAVAGYVAIVERAREIVEKMSVYTTFGISDRRNILVADGFRECYRENSIEAGDWPTIKQIDDALNLIEQAETERRGAVQSGTAEQQAIMLKLFESEHAALTH